MLPIPIIGGMGGSARLGKLQSMVRLGAVRLGNSNGNILSISNQSRCFGLGRITYKITDFVSQQIA